MRLVSFDRLIGVYYLGKKLMSFKLSIFHAYISNAIAYII